MGLPIAKILWAGNDPGPHGDHLHIEGIPRLIGWTTGRGAQPPHSNPGLTDSLWAVWIALHEKYGSSKYFLDGGTADWSHMGWYNRRPIGGKTQWSQHAWANALDIGPYYGVEEQQKFYDFLTGKEDDMTPAADKFWQEVYDQLQSELDPNTDASFAWRLVQHVRNHPSSGGLSETQARSLARDEIGKSRNVAG